MEYETAGDPITGLKWTRKTTEKVAKELRSGGINITSKTVGRLLRKLNFSLRVNHKKVTNSKVSPDDRNQQFAREKGDGGNKFKSLRPLFPITICHRKYLVTSFIFAVITPNYDKFIVGNFYFKFFWFIHSFLKLTIWVTGAMHGTKYLKQFSTGTGAWKHRSAFLRPVETLVSCFT